MNLTEEQKTIIEPKIRNKSCPMCGSKRLMFNVMPGQIVSYPFMNPEGTEIDTSKISWINALFGECMDCGYIIMFRLDTLLRTCNQ